MKPDLKESKKATARKKRDEFLLMDQKTASMVAAVLGAIGLILILAGPAFHFIPTNGGIFLALVSWLAVGVISGPYGKKGKGKED